MNAYLGLKNGEVFPGKALCMADDAYGEVVIYNSRNFHYQILTEPVNCGKIIVSDSEIVYNRWPLFPEIESFKPHLQGLVILGSLCKSKYQNKYYNLKNFLSSNMIPFFKPNQPERLKMILEQNPPLAGQSGIITSSLETAKRIQNENGNGYRDWNPSKTSANSDSDFTRRLSTSLEFFWDMPEQRRHNGKFMEKNYAVVAYDFGLPYSMLRNLKKYDCDIRIVPSDCSPEEVIALKPEGILLAGGPGNPEKMKYAIDNIARLVGIRPILATGLGHILLAMSMGVQIEYLKKPHFGNEIEVEQAISVNAMEKTRFKTDQTHLISLNKASLKKAGFKITLLNASDSTVEGYDNDEFLIQSYAFSLGGSDRHTLSCIERFIACMESHRAGERLI